MKEILIALIMIGAVIGAGYGLWQYIIYDLITSQPAVVGGIPYYVSQDSCESDSGKRCYFMVIS